MTDHADRISKLRTRVQKRREETPQPFSKMTDETLYKLRDQLHFSRDDGAEAARMVVAAEILRRRRQKRTPTPA